MIEQITFLEQLSVFEGIFRDLLLFGPCLEQVNPFTLKMQKNGDFQKNDVNPTIKSI